MDGNTADSSYRPTGKHSVRSDLLIPGSTTTIAAHLPGSTKLVQHAYRKARYYPDTPHFHSTRKSICSEQGIEAGTHTIHSLGAFSLCFPVGPSVLPGMAQRASRYGSLCFPVGKSVLPGMPI